MPLAAQMAAVHAGSGAELMPGLLEAMATEGLAPIGGDEGVISAAAKEKKKQDEEGEEGEGASWWWPF